jgi:transcription elongation factor Elf1
MFSCPICGRPEQTKTVAWHVWYFHVPNIACWCGTYFECGTTSAVERVMKFSAHCEARGGFLAHYLECQFGRKED